MIEFLIAVVLLALFIAIIEVARAVTPGAE